MTRDPRQPSHLEPLDDAAIEELVRDAASGWTMPAVRLDAPSWRDRVRSPGFRRVEAARGWLVRVGQAATAAVALTVVGALVAVLILRQPTEPGSSPNPTDRGPVPTDAAFTPLDKLKVKGEVPNPATVLVQLEEGNFALVDLGVGEKHPIPTGAVYGSVVQWRADGTLLCLCVKTGAMKNTQPTEAEITIDRFQADGTLVSSIPAVDLVGAPDPRDGTIAERPPHVTFDLQVSPGNRFAIIGWSVREHPVWKSGVTVIDLADGREVSRITLPDSTSGEGDTRRVVLAPRVLNDGADGAALITREWYSWSPPTSQGGNYQQETDLFRADSAGGVLSSPDSVLGAAGCGNRVIRAGTTAAGSWIVCDRGITNTLVVRRFDPAGSHLDDALFTGPAGVDGELVALSPDGDAFFAWNPRTAQLARVDLTTGEQVVSEAQTAAVPAAPLAALGNWIAPRVAAKTFLQSGVVVSPDGTRVYAAGVEGSEDIDGTAGSSGIFVFDATSLQSLAHWEPTADFISLAVSANGKYVYAAGLARFDADGNQRATQQASITVFKTTDGAIQVIAGQLGFDFLTFATPIVD